MRASKLKFLGINIKYWSLKINSSCYNSNIWSLIICTRYQHSIWFAPTLNSSAGCLVFSQKPVCANKVLYPIELGIPNSTEPSKLPFEFVSTKSGSHTLVSFKIKIKRRFKMRPKAQGTAQKGCSRSNSTIQNYSC